MLERAIRAARFGVRAGTWGAIGFGTCSVLLNPSVKSSEFISFVAFVLFVWFALFFSVTFALAYAFPPPGNRFEFPGAGKVVWPVIGLLFLATVALAWIAISSQTR